MKIKTIIIIVLAIILISFSIWEQIFIEKSLTKISSLATQIDNELTENKEINDDILQKVEKLSAEWEKTEYTFCYILNHSDLTEVGDAICYALTYIKQNNIDALQEKINVVKYYARSYLKLYSFDIKNIV